MLQWLETELQGLDLVSYRLLVLVMAVVCIYLLYRSYRAYHRYRFVDGTATSKIRSAPQGYVELKGLGEWMPGDQIYSPFSGERCLWFHCTIDEKRRSGKHSKWVNISNQKSHQLFQLVDDTGVCIIDPEHANITPELERSWYGSNLMVQNNPPPTSRSRLTSSVLFGFSGYRFRESLIRPASDIYVIGDFQTHRLEATESLVSRQVKDLLLEWKLKPGKYLKYFDVDGNGKIMDNEWKKIERAAREQVMANNITMHQPQNLMSKSANSKQPFILSAVTEQELVSQEKLLSLASIVTAFILFCTMLLCVTIRSPISN